VAEWTDELVEDRYSTIFNSCKDIKNGTDSSGDDTYAKYGEFTINLIKDAGEFVTKLKESIQSNYEFFQDMNQKYGAVNTTTYQLSTALDRESKYIEKLSESIIQFGQGNSCDFVPKHTVQLYNNFCAVEMKATDSYYESFSVIAVASLVLSIVLGLLGCGYYNNP
jgi:hypothetical protein